MCRYTYLFAVAIKNILAFQYFGAFLILIIRYAKKCECDPCDPGSQKIFNNCGNTLMNNFFIWSFSLESDEMKALWPNDGLSFNFYETFSNSIPKLTTFVKEAFDSMA